MTAEYGIHELSPFINWNDFFRQWGYESRFATIARIQGCDVCRASWLVSFPPEERQTASEAMQLLKEANRMLEQLDKDYRLTRTVSANGTVAAAIDAEVYLLYEKDEHKRKLVHTLAGCLTDAAVRKRPVE